MGQQMAKCVPKARDAVIDIIPERAELTNLVEMALEVESKLIAQKEADKREKVAKKASKKLKNIMKLNK